MSEYKIYNATKFDFALYAYPCQSGIQSPDCMPNAYSVKAGAETTLSIPSSYTFLMFTNSHSIPFNSDPSAITFYARVEKSGEITLLNSQKTPGASYSSNNKQHKLQASIVEKPNETPAFYFDSTTDSIEPIYTLVNKTNRKVEVSFCGSSGFGGKPIMIDGNSTLTFPYTEDSNSEGCVMGPSPQIVVKVSFSPSECDIIPTNSTAFLSFIADETSRYGVANGYDSNGNFYLSNVPLNWPIGCNQRGAYAYLNWKNSHLLGSTIYLTDQKE